MKWEDAEKLSDAIIKMTIRYGESSMDWGTACGISNVVEMRRQSRARARRFRAIQRLTDSLAGAVTPDE